MALQEPVLPALRRFLRRWVLEVIVELPVFLALLISTAIMIAIKKQEWWLQSSVARDLIPGVWLALAGRVSWFVGSQRSLPEEVSRPTARGLDPITSFGHR